MKFVILDEVDYMTKNAQQALRYLIQQYPSTVRVCLICNYISRIDVSLQNELVRLRFCQLPSDKIFGFLNNIQIKEKLDIDKDTLCAIQRLFKSDIRSMINFIQSNHTRDCRLIESNIVTGVLWENLIILLQDKSGNIEDIYSFVEENSSKYNIEIKIFVKDFISYLIYNKEYALSENWITLFKYVIS